MDATAMKNMILSHLQFRHINRMKKRYIVKMDITVNMEVIAKIATL